MELDVSTLERDLLKLAQLARVELEPDDIQIEVLPAPHERPTWRRGRQVVYAFFCDGECLKVGKAGPRSAARFTSQHYRLGSAPSTLAASLVANRVEWLSDIGTISADSLDKWISTNTGKVHVFIPARFPTCVLGLIESFLQCRWEPLFDGGLSNFG